MKKYIHIFSIQVALFAVIGMGACKKITEEKPDYIYTEDDAIKTKEDVQLLLNSCYDAFANQVNGKVQTYNDLMSDDLAKPLKDDLGFKTEIYNRNTNIFNSDVGDLYRNLYLIPFRVNSIDKFLTTIPMPDDMRIRIGAEGKFLRAACHFEVLKLWAQPSGFSPANDHPGIVVRDVVSQLPKTRSTVAQSYAFIVSDLQYAIANLPVKGSNGNYATSDAAKALLAKVYYMMNKPAEAIALLNQVIPNYSLSDSLNRFDNTTATSEYIFATVSNNASNDNRAGEFIGKYRCDKNQPEYVLSKDLYALITSDTLDKRAKLVQLFNAGKDNEYYGVTKFNKDYFGVPYLHLTDMILLRAELSAETGDLGTAIADVNSIIKRAYSNSSLRELPGGSNAADVLAEVRKQRRLELFCEGDRVQTLKRRGANNTDPGYNPSLKIRNAPWNCPGLTLQFPSTETSSGFVFNGTGGCN